MTFLESLHSQVPDTGAEAQQRLAGLDSHRCTVTGGAVHTCGAALMADVSSLLRERFDGIDDELEIHIEDAEHQYLMAYERFQLHGNPHDRDEALLHLHRMNAAILARSPGLQALRHAAFERALQVDFFGAMGERDRAFREDRVA